MFFTIPTLMTWTRIVAIPLIVGVYYWPGLTGATQNLIATSMFVVFAITDWLDGYLPASSTRLRPLALSLIRWPTSFWSARPC